MATLNPRAQIALVLAQMEFFLKDLSTVQNCVSYSNYQTFFNLLKNNADLTKLVMRVGTVSGKNKYKRK
ncbi:hypothetical protein HMPREF9093_00177 [Fusobacterium sp. oral taxon 370 str. F0437]|uniref:hypothetical protein n=1 Tax=Fusobacterium sp. oral taxon 370 TaxID=712288 RepID=UPI000234A59B|nr:hypothetical protein [Fusobacterium sp. oral taxon 370]EHI79552.1 hypothetical protein HMPREF9093_00177 [Fusobacterium sp. oral taxon 370 str. F0437]